MSDLIQYPAQVCTTATGMLIHEQKVLLIKHKKLGLWLCPGGHVDSGELPHQAAERETFEETGIKVKAVDYLFQADTETQQWLPSPVETNLHWISQKRFNQRIDSDQPDKPVVTDKWPRGCEQHLALVYLVEPAGSIEHQLNQVECTDIGWFSLADLDSIKLTHEMKQQIKHGFFITKEFRDKPLYHAD